MTESQERALRLLGFDDNLEYYFLAWSFMVSSRGICMSRAPGHKGAALFPFANGALVPRLRSGSNITITKPNRDHRAFT